MDNSWYWAPLGFIVILSSFGFIISGVVYLIDKAEPWNEQDKWGTRETNRKNARLTLMFLALIPASFLWPVGVPLALLFIIFKLIQDARSK